MYAYHETQMNELLLLLLLIGKHEVGDAAWCHKVTDFNCLLICWIVLLECGSQSNTTLHEHSFPLADIRPCYDHTIRQVLEERNDGMVDSSRDG